MIGQLKYEDILKVSKTLDSCINDINTIKDKVKSNDLSDFISTVEAYSKYLETLVELNVDADKALQDLKTRKD